MEEATCMIAAAITDGRFTFLLTASIPYQVYAQAIIIA
jgi:hypothetical protein